MSDAWSVKIVPQMVVIDILRVTWQTRRGKLYIIHRTDRMIELINLLTKYKLGIKRLQIIYPNKHSNGSMIIIEAKKNCKHDVKILSPIFTNI